MIDNGKVMSLKLYSEYYPKVAYYSGIAAIIISVTPIIPFLYTIIKNFLLILIPIGMSCLAIVYGFISLLFSEENKKKSKNGIILGVVSIALFLFWYFSFFYLYS